MTAEFAARLDRLERQNRRLKHVFAAVALLFAGVAAAQVVAPKPVVASRVTLADDENRTRAQLENGTPGGGRAAMNPMLSFYDQSGQVVLRIGIGQRGPTLAVIDANGRVHEYLGGPTMRPATQH